MLISGCKIKQKFLIVQLKVYFCNQKRYKLKASGIFILFVALFLACESRKEKVVTPWGDQIEMAGEEETDPSRDVFDLSQIQQAGELIALTISGPQTYYDYRGNHLGLHAMLCQIFADTLGVRLRWELCRDTTELLQRLRNGDGDLIAFPLATTDSLGWVFGTGRPRLQEAYLAWYRQERMAQVRAAEQRLLASGGGVQRKVFAPMQNRSKGIISSYDPLFRQQAQLIRWDWRLMAAQCYQESTFDPMAVSWAGARGLMQIMPQTADHLGIPREELHQPAQNIAAAARYLHELEDHFSDIPSRRERQDFVLAAYNGGAHHIRDAMALARKDGRDARRWGVVAEYVLKLSDPRYYEDPDVRYGYMRGSETVSYVRAIRQRYHQYRGVKGPASGSSQPQKSRNERHRKKYKV